MDLDYLDYNFWYQKRTDDSLLGNNHWSFTDVRALILFIYVIILKQGTMDHNGAQNLNVKILYWTSPNPILAH